MRAWAFLKRFGFGALVGAGSGLVAGLGAAIDLLSDREWFVASDWVWITLGFSALSALVAGSVWDLGQQVKTWLGRRGRLRPEPLWDHDVDGPPPGQPDGRAQAHRAR